MLQNKPNGVDMVELEINLKKLRFEKELSQEELGKKLGVTKQQIGRIENGLSNLTQEKKEILLKLYPDLQSNAPASETVKLDFYPDVFASCGFGSYALSENKEQLSIPKKCFVKPFSEFKQYSVILARGNSMETTIYDKDKLIVEHYTQGEQIKDNAIYVFCYGEEIYIKRLFKNIDEIIIKSDNPDPIYKTKFVSGEDMNKLIVIGEIVGLMRDLR